MRGRRHGEVWEASGSILVAVRRRNQGWDMLVLAGEDDPTSAPDWQYMTGDVVWWHDSSFRSVGYERWGE